MFSKFSASIVILSMLGVSNVAANPVSLFIPGAEVDQPFTADLLGTDSSGHTTWRLGIGSASGSFTATDGAGAYPSVTLIEGSTDIHIIQAIPTSGATEPNLPTQAEQNCVYSTAAGAQSGAAVCTVLLEAADQTMTTVATITGNVVEVQVAATVTGSGSPSTPTATASGGTAATSTSGTATATQTQTGKGNGVGKTSLAASFALGLVSLVNVLLL